MKILIVDDSKAMRMFLNHLVQALRFETALAEDGCDGLERLQATEGVGLVLVDWDMPRMNGLEFVKAVRAIPKFNEVKIMMVTTQNSMERVTAAIGAGATDFLMKPVSESSLTDKLRVLGAVE
ncbi:MAG TPA: response regulator [Opitutaceae bacterium]|jgi:two-component system chemotaxis response regulator CheY|nr:response regulator [Opitutaceae bacterium]